MSKQSKYNAYEVKKTGDRLSFKVMKMLAKGKKRTDSIVLNAKQVASMKAAAKKSLKDYYKVCNDLILKPCKLGSKAAKEGTTLETGYEPSHFLPAKALGIKLSFPKSHYLAKK
jgi:hypothetical protein